MNQANVAAASRLDIAGENQMDGNIDPTAYVV
jgi:hypothetical protein